MKKSLVIIASALLLAVAAAGSDRLRYDSSVFADTGGPGGGPRAVRVEYPPCVPGVREDRCIQLYERGVKRSYQRWLAAHGRGGEQVAARGPTRARAYPACRGRNDDRCEQRAGRHARALRHARGTRHARATRQGRAVRQAQAVRQPRQQQVNRAAAHTVTYRRPATVQPTPQRVVRHIQRTRTTTTNTTTTVQRQRQRPVPTPRRPSPPPVGTPGI